MNLRKQTYLRMLEHVAISADFGCWIWQGRLRKGKYPVEYDAESMENVYVKKWLWEYENKQPVPDGHTLRTPRSLRLGGCGVLCVNPAHREPIPKRPTTSKRRIAMADYRQRQKEGNEA